MEVVVTTHCATMSYTTEAQRWRALATRDPNANGHFFYSVKSTQIYCRPTCPARLARRANISFQKTIAEAEALGFRACKRCRPNVENEDPQDKAVAKALGFIEEAARKGDAKKLKLHDIAKKVGLTPRYFHKIFKDKTGTTPREYTNIIAAQQSNTTGSSCSGSSTSPTNPDSFDWDTFDISELAEYQFDSQQTLEDDFLMQAAQITAAGFGGASIHGLPQQYWTASSPTDSMLSSEHLLDLGEWEPASVNGEQCQNATSLLDPAFDFDLHMCMAFLDDQAITTDMAPSLDMRYVPDSSV